MSVYILYILYGLVSFTGIHPVEELAKNALNDYQGKGCKVTSAQ